MTRPDQPERTGAPLMARCALGGVLMGLANLVPGISGGTMLLAAGIYPRFIRSVADVTTLRLSRRSVAVLATVAGSAAAAILLLAGPTKDLVVDRRWVMYSLFIGLTLGGVPLVWSMARPATRATWIGAACGALAMILLTLAQVTGLGEGSGAGSGFVMLMVAGVAGASAMILPGVSGGYLLLVLGQYVPILASIDRLKDGLGARDVGAVAGEWTTVVPVGLGVVIGIVGVSNALRWALSRYAKATLGVLLGLLVGAVFGLWPFQQGREPHVGEVIRGVEVTPAAIGSIARDDWPVALFTPSALQVVASVALIGAGFLVTRAIARLGGSDGSQDETAPC